MANDDPQQPMKAKEDQRGPMKANAGHQGPTATQDDPQRPTKASAGQRRGHDGLQMPTNASTGHRRPITWPPQQQRDEGHEVSFFGSFHFIFVTNPSTSPRHQHRYNDNDDNDIAITTNDDVSTTHTTCPPSLTTTTLQPPPPMTTKRPLASVPHHHMAMWPTTDDDDESMTGPRDVSSRVYYLQDCTATTTYENIEGWDNTSLSQPSVSFFFPPFFIYYSLLYTVYCYDNEGSRHVVLSPRYFFSLTNSRRQ